ncbi:MAG: PIN domain-containing protein [Mangrovibacterium sp.]
MERKNYLIDTNVVIYYLGLALSKESEKLIDHILSGNYHISVINRIELLGFSKLTKKETIVLESFVAGSTVLDLDEEVIRETIQIRKTHSIETVN